MVRKLRISEPLSMDREFNGLDAGTLVCRL
jgi:hypothetical protein